MKIPSLIPEWEVAHEEYKQLKRLSKSNAITFDERQRLIKAYGERAVNAALFGVHLSILAIALLLIKVVI